MNTAKTLENGVLTVELDGKLDNTTTPSLGDEIKAYINDTDKLIIDMKNLNYFSSAGLRLLLSLHKKMKKKGGMIIKNVNSENMEVFELTGFKDILNIE